MLIVIDPIRKIYKRYVGRNCTHKAEAAELLTPAEVESFRVSPDASIVEEEDANKVS